MTAEQKTVKKKKSILGKGMIYSGLKINTNKFIPCASKGIDESSIAMNYHWVEPRRKGCSQDSQRMKESGIFMASPCHLW